MKQPIARVRRGSIRMLAVVLLATGWGCGSSVKNGDPAGVDPLAEEAAKASAAAFHSPKGSNQPTVAEGATDSSTLKAFKQSRGKK
jgi:hypothetical protein